MDHILWLSLIIHISKFVFDLFLFRLIGKKHFTSVETWRASLL
jgi:hypothetical protein